MKDLSLVYLLQLAWRRIYVLVAAFVFFAVAAFCFCEFVATPSYTATSSILLTNGGSLVNSTDEDIDYIGNNDIIASINLMETYTDFLKEPKIYRQLAEVVNTQLNGEYTVAQLRSMASIQKRTENSLFIDISFKANDPDVAILLTNTFANLAPQYFADTFEKSTVEVTSEAERAVQTYPNTLVTTAIMGLLGAVLGYVAVLIIDSFDQAISGEKDYANHFDIPLIGTVPYFESASADNYGNYK